MHAERAERHLRPWAPRPLPWATLPSPSLPSAAFSSALTAIGRANAIAADHLELATVGDGAARGAWWPPASRVSCFDLGCRCESKSQAAH